MRVLITGGTGFLGKAVARALPGYGWSPILLAPDAPTEVSDDLRNFEYVQADVTDREGLGRVMHDARPEAIVHLAAYGEGGAGLLSSAGADPYRAVLVNICGFLALIECAHASGCRKLVWSSSTTVYGPAHYYPTGVVDEEAPPRPRTVYGTTKLACELLSGAITPADMKITGLRLPLVYGPGRWYGGALETLLSFARDVLSGRPSSVSVSEQSTDLLYVDDAVTSLMRTLTSTPSRHVYNVAGEHASLAQLAREIIRHASAPAEVIPVEDAEPFPLIDGRRAFEELGLRTTVSLREGVDRWIEAERRYGLEERVT
jgi:nucleoside-diphosphate-sugar epimerase